MSAGEQERKETTKKTGGRRYDWQQIYVLTVYHATTFSFVLTGNNSAIFTKEKKKECVLWKKTLSDGHSDQLY